MGRFLTGLITCASLFIAGCSSSPYAGWDLTFRDTNGDGLCDTFETVHYKGPTWNSLGYSNVHTYKLPFEMNQIDINFNPDIIKARKNGAKFYFPNNCGALVEDNTGPLEDTM